MNIKQLFRNINPQVKIILFSVRNEAKNLILSHREISV